MKSRETKQKDLTALTESLAASKSAMLVSFTGLTVAKDQEFRNSLREAGAKYEVVKNTLARIAVKGTQFEEVSEHFKGVTAIAWTENDPVVLSKAISKFMKDNADIYTFKTGVVDGKVVDLKQLTTIASLPSKEELISKLLYVLNAQAQRIVTVINAVPRNLAVVVDQIGKQEGRAAATPATSEPAPAETATEAHEEAVAAAEDDAAQIAVGSTPSEDALAAAPDDASVDALADEPIVPPAEVATEAREEAVAAAPDDAAGEILEIPPAPEGEKPE